MEEQGLSLPAQLLKEQADRLNPPIKVRDMKLLIGRVQIVIGEAEPIITLGILSTS